MALGLCFTTAVSVVNTVVRALCSPAGMAEVPGSHHGGYKRPILLVHVGHSVSVMILTLVVVVMASWLNSSSGDRTF